MCQLSSVEFNQTENNTWHCCRCNSVNCSSFLYQAYNINVSNSYDLLSGIPGDDSVFQHSVESLTRSVYFRPIAHSSPCLYTSTVHNNQVKNITSLSANCLSEESNGSDKSSDNLRITIENVNSTRGRKAELAHFCNTMQPDIILVSESKLDKSIKHSAFLPPNYVGHLRNERTLNGGGVMIIHMKDLVIDEIELDKPDLPHYNEIVWARLSIHNESPVYIASYYRPTSDYSFESNTSLQSLLRHIFLILLGTTLMQV